MVQCPDGHLFCKHCISSYASTLLGEHNADIECMDQSGCKLPFSVSELGRFLAPKLLDLYHRIVQQKAIEAAGIEGLEECPFCEYKVVIENEQEKLFQCEREDCGAVSCRSCKKLASILLEYSYKRLTKQRTIYLKRVKVCGARFELFLRTLKVGQKW